MSRRPSLSKSNRAPPDPVDCGMKYVPSGPQSCLKCRPTASVTSSNQGPAIRACSFVLREGSSSLPDFPDFVHAVNQNDKPATITMDLAKRKNISPDAKCSELHLAIASGADLRLFGLL